MSQTSSISVQEALETFYENQKLDFQTTTQFINYYPLGFVQVPFFNIKARQEILHLHDLNHILMGFDTSLKGEAQLAALELASGFPKGCRIGYLYSPFALLPGLILCPGKLISAFAKGRKMRNACHIKLNKEDLLKSRLTDVFKLLKIQPRLEVI